MAKRLTIPHGTVCLFSILSVACASDQGFGTGGSDSKPGVPDVEFSIDIALQRSGWGESLGRCHLQAALRLYEPTEEEMKPYGNANGTVVEVPNEPMTCAHTLIEDQPEPVDIGGSEDNWAIAGEDIASDEIHLISEHHTIVLNTVELESGSVRYEWGDCSQETFPFGTVFDLHFPSSPEAHIRGFTVPEAFAVGADVALTSPATLSDHRHDQSDDLEITWEQLHSVPDVRNETVQVDRTVWARNRWMDQHQPFEALGCLPEEDGMIISTDDLWLLQANHPEDETNTIVGIQVDTVVTSPPFDTPWGRTISVRSTVSDGGDLVLMAPDIGDTTDAESVTAP